MPEVVLATATLSSKNQITLPKRVREKLGLKPNDTIVFIEKDGEIVIRRAELSY